MLVQLPFKHEIHVTTDVTTPTQPVYFSLTFHGDKTQNQLPPAPPLLAKLLEANSLAISFYYSVVPFFASRST